MLASEIFASARAVLNDPSPGTYWIDATDFVPWLNQFVRWACGFKPDLYPKRVKVQLAPGVDQQIPADGHQILDARYAGNGQAVFVYKMDEVKHAKFSNLASQAAVDNVKVVVTDPRHPLLYYTFPPSTGSSSSTLQIVYGAIPAPMASGASTYTLGDETQDCAVSYLLYWAYRKNTDRTDLNKAAEYRKQAMEWIANRTQVQFAEAAQADQ